VRAEEEWDSVWAEDQVVGMWRVVGVVARVAREEEKGVKRVVVVAAGCEAEALQGMVVVGEKREKEKEVDKVV
jgi:crotonobetainyl-CoA:carnitine CoA-transferase CaiB-like acyl-CoA transferase